MEDTKELLIALKEIQSRVIGLFRPQYYPNNMYIPVIANNDGVLTCVEIYTLLGLSTLVISITEGRYVEFPKTDGDEVFGPLPQTLTDMMKLPLQFYIWYRENVYPSQEGN